MNFDKLKSEWGKDGSNEVYIPENIKKMKTSSHPIEGLKRSMKNELYFQVFSIMFLAFYPDILKLEPQLIPIYYVCYSMLTVISGYYLYGFYKFYKSLSPYSLDTKSSLFAIHYELKLNMEKYKSFGFIILPLGLIVLGLHFYNQHLLKGESLDFLTNRNVFVLAFTSMVLIGLIMFAIKSWINIFYGRYVKQIKAILDELIEE